MFGASKFNLLRIFFRINLISVETFQNYLMPFGHFVILQNREKMAGAEVAVDHLKKKQQKLTNK